MIPSALKNAQPKLTKQVGCLSLRYDGPFEASGVSQFYTSQISTAQIGVLKPAFRQVGIPQRAVFENRIPEIAEPHVRFAKINSFQRHFSKRKLRQNGENQQNVFKFKADGLCFPQIGACHLAAVDRDGGKRSAPEIGVAEVSALDCAILHVSAVEAGCRGSASLEASSFEPCSIERGVFEIAAIETPV
nr:hypothetical protein [Roseibium marinum]